MKRMVFGIDSQHDSALVAAVIPSTWNSCHRETGHVW